MKYFIYDGKVYAENVTIAGPESRALRYGDGLFETLRYANNKLAFADEHFSRLWKGMQVLGFEIPKHFNPDKLQSLFTELLIKNGHNFPARIRLSVFRGDGGLYDPVNNQPHFTIQTWALEAGHGQWNSNGLVAGIHEGARKSCDVLSNLKHNNFLPYLLAAREAKASKWNDAILLNQHGRICDSSIANIFLIKNDVILTPALEEGCVAGIMRKIIIQELRSRFYKVEETAVTVDDLLSADEVFFTNSIHPIRWIKEIRDATYGNNLTQKIYSELIQTIL
jgi:branched-chain amino acid aminotransferase